MPILEYKRSTIVRYLLRDLVKPLTKRIKIRYIFLLGLILVKNFYSMYYTRILE